MSKRKDEDKDRDLMPELGISRRQLLKRGAVAGGTLLWVAPVIKSLTPPAFASQQSPPPGPTTCCCSCAAPASGGGEALSCTEQFTTASECQQACENEFGFGSQGNFGCGQVCDGNECVSENGD